MRFDDPALGIDWRVKPEHWNLSDKDRKHPAFADVIPLEVME